MIAQQVQSSRSDGERLKSRPFVFGKGVLRHIYIVMLCRTCAFVLGHIRFDGGYTTQYCVEFAVACRSHTTSMLPHTILTLLVLLVSSPSKYNSMLTHAVLGLRT